MGDPSPPHSPQPCCSLVTGGTTGWNRFRAVPVSIGHYSRRCELTQYQQWQQHRRITWCDRGGAALVVLAGAVPRAARPDPAVPARQMERLEARAARLRARLDRCTVAGLALLALGGLLLAALLTYGSVRLRMRRVSAEGTRALLENQLSPPSQPPEGPGS
ncbi:PREDICTED: transmembrane protein 74B [Haliaeetus leucocephalus]|uniref:transmembrane protein 74B n=1 Tax=Haliaeetus leucocephalus TaxID=52644 RepID=UPI00053CC82C|nr:PREDICTED: transmembrane protein 74B [Haliaeetus leucocephalus]